MEQKPFNTMICFCCIVMVWLNCLHANAQEIDSLAKEISGMISDAHESLGFSGVVLVAIDDKVIVHEAKGKLGPKNGDNVELDSLFEIGTVTQPFTALACYLLAKEQKLKLDESVDKVLPNVPEIAKPITIRHLLKHTSGVPKDSYGNGSSDPIEFVPSFLGVWEDRQVPGKITRQWNQGYILLSVAIEKASGMPFKDFMRKSIFEPAKMTSACFVGDKIDDESKISAGHTGRLASEPLKNPIYGIPYQGMGGIVCTAEDLFRFVKCVNDGTLLPKAEQDDWLGDGTITFNKDIHMFNWYSEQQGFLVLVKFCPKAKTALIITANSCKSSTGFHNFQQAVSDRLARATIPLPKERVFDDITTKELVGEYVLDNGRRPPNQKLVISKLDNGLITAIYWGRATPDTNGHLENDDGRIIFVEQYTGRRLELQLSKNSDGSISEILIELGDREGYIGGGQFKKIK